jgi:hypothetical protein
MIHKAGGGEPPPLPPPDVPAPPDAGRASTPGPAPLRRLTRAQYRNTVRDLLGVDADPALAFALDEDEGGFKANSRAPVKELQVEQYQKAAESLAALAVSDLRGLAPCAPPADSEERCLDWFLRDFGTRAYRRPLDAPEAGRYRALFAAGKDAGGGFAAGLAVVITAMLQSPHFLYRVELGQAAAGAREAPLTDWEIAARLSYLLQNTMPDQELLEAARTGRLRAPEDIAAQARRLLAAPRARDALASFFTQWLRLEDLPTTAKDPAVYEDFTPDLRADMEAEVLAFVDDVVRAGDGRLATLLTAGHSFLRDGLYALYGVPMPAPPAGSRWKKVELPAGERAGVLTLAGVLATHAHVDQSSPVARGLLVSERLLCRIPPPPPPGINNTPPRADPAVATRARFEQHRTNPACAGCHALMDPLGLPFEIYDGMGRHRIVDGNRPVDASSELKGTSQDGPVRDALELVRRLAAAEEVHACLVKQWLRYAFGRVETDEDAGTLATALRAFTGSGGRIPDLLLALVTSPAFRTRQPIALP